MILARTSPAPAAPLPSDPGWRGRAVIYDRWTPFWFISRIGLFVAGAVIGLMWAVLA